MSGFHNSFRQLVGGRKSDCFALRDRHLGSAFDRDIEFSLNVRLWNVKRCCAK